MGDANLKPKCFLIVRVGIAVDEGDRPADRNHCGAVLRRQRTVRTAWSDQGLRACGSRVIFQFQEISCKLITINVQNSLEPDALGKLSTELAECWNVVWSLMLSRQLL